MDGERAKEKLSERDRGEKESESGREGWSETKRYGKREREGRKE